MSSLMSSLSTDPGSIPQLPIDSPGSSVSSNLLDEYDEILKYAVVVPTMEVSNMPQTLVDFKGSFPQFSHANNNQNNIQASSSMHHGVYSIDQNQDIQINGVQSRNEEDLTNIESMNKQEKEVFSASFEDDQTKSFNSSIPPTMGQTKALELTKKWDMRPVSPSTSSEATLMSVAATSEMDNVDTFSSVIDEDMSRMQQLIDNWSQDLKHNVLGEFSATKIKMLQIQKHNLLKERERHSFEINKLHDEIQDLKECVNTYDQSIQRKNKIISNLSEALHKQKNKMDVAKSFYEWKVNLNDNKRENFEENLSDHHYTYKLKKKVYHSWHGIIQNKWKVRLEKACQARAQEVCIKLTQEYDDKIKSLDALLEESRNECRRLREARETYEDTMKRAFMRGVNALNMEAISMFSDQEDKASSNKEHVTKNHQTDEMIMGVPYTIPQEPVYQSEPHGAPTAKVYVCQNPAPMHELKKPIRKSKISAKVDTGLGPGNSTLAPPMSSVVVEKHHPITKQTIGQAIAAKYPKKS